MKVLFCGLGSIGRRHLSNLCALCEGKGIELDITALRFGEHELPEEVACKVHRQVRNIEKDEHFDIAFITNPTHLHAITIGELSAQTDAFFIEKPIFEHADYELSKLGLSSEKKAYVAAPMRHTKLYVQLNNLLQNVGGVYSARAICSSYLPNWRKNVDYRNVYSAHKAMGGGVGLDLIHEWDYIVDLFGMPEKGSHYSGHVSKLEIDSDDLAVYIAKWPNMMLELHLDYFGRTYRRTLELMAEDGSITADFGTGMLTLPNGEVQNYAEDANVRYLREMEYFLGYVCGNEPQSINSPQKALQVLGIATKNY